MYRWDYYLKHHKYGLLTKPDLIFQESNQYSALHSTGTLSTAQTTTVPAISEDALSKLLIKMLKSFGLIIKQNLKRNMETHN